MISPQKAAERAGVSRRTIMVAIESKTLKAQRNNRNHWQISPADLDEWMGNRGGKQEPISAKVSDTTTDTATEHTVEIARLSEQLKAAEDRVSVLEGQLERQEADFRDQIARRDADYREAMDLLREAQRKRGLLEMIFGSKDKTPSR